MVARISVGSRFGPKRCHGGCDLKPQPAPLIGRALHIDVHALPRDVPRLLLVAFLALAWLMFLPRAAKLRAVAAATAYSFIEYGFTFLSNGKAFTSFAQLWGNLLYTPLLLDVYGMYVGQNPVLYVLLFPFNIWLLEVVLDRLFVFVYGRNVAWCYCTYDDSYVGGAVRLGHGIYWLMLGGACFVLHPLMLAHTTVMLAHTTAAADDRIH